MGFASLLIIIFISLIFPIQGQAEMVYLHQKSDQRRVALADDQGKMIRLLTPESLQAYHPEISANGRYVAYSIGTIRSGEVDVAIHVLYLETGDTEVWTQSGDQYIHAEFSGNGEYLAFSGPVELENNNTAQLIHLVDLPAARANGPVRSEEEDGKTVSYFEPETEIIPSEHQCYFPAVSSDGSFVVYHRTREEENGSSSKELVLYSRAQKTKTLLTEKGRHAVAPSLSWDNRYAAFAALRNGQWDLHLLDLWSKESRQLTHSPGKEFTPVFDPDGSLTYTHISANENMQLDLYRISRDQVFGRALVQPQPFIADPGVMEYIPAFSGETWFSLRQKPDLPEPARSSFGAVAYQGKIYVAGGHHGPEHTYPPESFLDRLDIYDLETGTWSRGASMSVPRQGFEMAAHKGFLYAFGGFAYSGKNTPNWKSLAIIERYDIANDRWEVLPEKLPRRRSSNIAATVGTKVYLIGGWDSTPKHPGDKEGKFHRAIDIFDLQAKRAYTASYKLPSPLRRAFTAVVQKEKVWLLGGISEGASHFDWLDNVTLFDPQAGQWRDMPPLPFATFAPGAGVYQGKLFLFGGMNQEGRYQNTIYSLEMSQPRSWHNTGRYLQENKGFPIVVHHPGLGLSILGGHTYIFTHDGVIDTPVSIFEQLIRRD